VAPRPRAPVHRGCPPDPGVCGRAPLITAIAGLLLGGLAVNFITRALQDRRAANQLEFGLIGEITETASSLYHHIAMYTRAQTDVGAGPAKPVDDQETSELRKKLLEQYPVSRAKAEVVQARLKAYFTSTRLCPG
jgi:hypothetical protein